MLRLLRDPRCEAHEEFKAKTKMGARLGTDHLVGALNEHVSGMRGGRWPGRRLAQERCEAACRCALGCGACTFDWHGERHGLAVRPSPHPGAQLTERRKGNKAYREGDYDAALNFYERAAAVVDFVQVGGTWRAAAASHVQELQPATLSVCTNKSPGGGHCRDSAVLTSRRSTSTAWQCT
jgi:hypothetical protein